MTITDFIEENGLLTRGDRVLCAVSGGADSMCMLHWLHENAEKLGITVCAASFDHMLRGEESAADCRFVAEWCAKNGVACVTGSGNVRARAQTDGLSEEEAARACRYEFLQKSAQELSCNLIATAHNANDNAETLLFNLARGGGLKGLCGIPPKRGNIIRPLLAVTREEIERYNAENGIEFVTDSSNAADDYTRNRIRHHVTPVLRDINPAFFSAASRTAQLLREDEKCLDDMAREALDKYYANRSFPAAELLRLPKPIAMRVLRHICGSSLSYAHAQAVYDIARSSEFKSADISGMRVSCDRGVLHFNAQRVTIAPRTLLIGQCVPIPELGMEVRADIVDDCKEVFKSFNILYFKYDSICGNISFTSRQNGDKLRLAHRRCTKSLKDLFSEAKMSVYERDLTPVLRDDKGVIAVYGFGTDERALARPGDRVIRVTINKTEHTGDN